jgi:hypothetical protein
MPEPVQQKRYRIIDLIMYILSFFFHRQELKKENEQRKLNQTVDEVQKSYAKIDVEKQNKRVDSQSTQSDVQKKLDNLF